MKLLPVLSTDEIKQLKLLKIRSLIADKEMVIATANMDLTRGDQWRCDYSSWQQSINAEIAELMKELEGE